MTSFYQQRLQELQARGLLRQRRTVQGPQGPRIRVDGKTLLCFASNDYLGLANHPDLIRAAQGALESFGVGAGASALISGHAEPVEALEMELARWQGRERALHFSTGYMANLGIIPALSDDETDLFSDALNHASLIDGIRLARSRSVNVYAHGDLQHLEHLLSVSSAPRKWIITDGVFSMDGDMAPMGGLVGLADRYDAQILVDDAHGLGVLGVEGRGTLSHLGVASPRVLLMATLGKAAGVFGAFVTGPATMIEWLMQRARTYIFTTGTPPALAAACLASLERVRADQFRRDRLRQLGQQLQEGLGKAFPKRGLTTFWQESGQTPFRVLPSETAIHPVIVGDNARVTRVADALRDRGIWVPAIRPPTVPEGMARLRISLSAAHEPEDVERLIEALKGLA
jgi:8-amino-7-oxononanoate synthase